RERETRIFSFFPVPLYLPPRVKHSLIHGRKSWSKPRSPIWLFVSISEPFANLPMRSCRIPTRNRDSSGKTQRNRSEFSRSRCVIGSDVEDFEAIGGGGFIESGRF
ncbi:hypothetical protein F2P56_021758, partial [Juglans regia]